MPRDSPRDIDYVILGTYAEIIGRPGFNWLGWGVMIGLFLWGYAP